MIIYSIYTYIYERWQLFARGLSAALQMASFNFIWAIPTVTLACSNEVQITQSHRKCHDKQKYNKKQ